MSSLIKSRSIVLGDPLEIKTEDLTVVNGCSEEETPGHPPVEDGAREEALGILEDARERAAQLIARAEEKAGKSTRGPSRRAMRKDMKRAMKRASERGSPRAMTGEGSRVLQRWTK